MWATCAGRGHSALTHKRIALLLFEDLCLPLQVTILGKQKNKKLWYRYSTLWYIALLKTWWSINIQKTASYFSVEVNITNSYMQKSKVMVVIRKFWIQTDHIYFLCPYVIVFSFILCDIRLWIWSVSYSVSYNSVTNPVWKYLQQIFIPQL